MNNKKIDILGLGCISVDDIIYVDHYPRADEKISVLNKKREVGGLTGRALITASNLGAKCAYSGTLGRDELTKFIIDNLISSKINIDFIEQNKNAGPIHSVSIVSEDDSSRNLFFDLKNWKKGTNNKISYSKIIKFSKILFIDNYIGIPNAIAAVKKAIRLAIPIVADIEDDDHDSIDELLSLIDHLIISESFAERITGYSDPSLAIKTLWDDKKKFLAITCGENGCWYQGFENMKINYYPIEKVPVKDTTGCGDVFHGAYAYALARDYNLEDRVKLASKMASLKAQGIMPNKNHL